VAATRVEEQRRAIDAGVIEAFAAMYRADRSTTILQRNRELLALLQQTARVRYEAGEGLLENVLKAGTESALLEVDLELLKQERAAAEASLRALLNAPGRSFGPATDLPAIASLDPDTLRRAALDNAVDIQAADAMARRDEARLDLARRELKPDMKWEAGYAYRGSLDPMVMGLFGVRLPLHRGSNQAQGIVQADQELRAARAEADAARLRVTSEVEILLARADRASRLASIYEESVLPQARAALESSVTAYGVGRIEFLAVLTDLSSVLRRELDLENQRSDRLMAVAGLERLTGLSLVGEGERP
jgi:outer membrane protein, heavy metal efflux system